MLNQDINEQWRARTIPARRSCCETKACARGIQPQSRSWNLLWLVPFLVLAIGCASVRTKESATRETEYVAQLTSRVREILEAAERKEFDRLESYHLYGPKFTRFSESSPGRLDADTTRRQERAGITALADLKMRADDLKIDVFDNVAIATFILDYSFEVNGQTLRRKERTTMVLVRESGQWKIAHEHLSRIKEEDKGGS